MKVLMCHNYYQLPGGEDNSFAQEVELLKSYGHEVVTFTQHNDDIRGMGKVGLAARTVWNPSAYRQLSRLIEREGPQVMHCTNTFPLISPAAYYAAKRRGVAVVQSLRNYRLLCPNGLLLRQGRVCEDCVGSRVAWRAVRYKCYRDSRSASAVVALHLALHRGLGTWNRAVDMYFALTEFSRRKFVEGGLPDEQLAVKPNFLHPDPGAGAAAGDYALFVGRLSPEKGIATLLSAWSQLPHRLPLKIVGDGPLREQVVQACLEDPRLTWLGHRDSSQVLELLGDARCLVMPSLWYEGFPRTIVEAFAKGTPVITSQLGSMAEIVEHDRNGLHFPPGDAERLAQAVAEFLRDPARQTAMRQAARQSYLHHYTAERNYELLMAIYERARDRAGAE